jgi:hypothetical protein
MALFRRAPKPVYGIAEPEVKAAVGYGYQQQGNQGASQIGPPYYAYADDAARARCMSVPTISRARDLIASVIGCLPLEMYTLQWNGEEMEEIPLAPRSWLQRLDPDNTNNFTLSWLFDDLFFFGVGYLHVKTRTADGYPASFQRLPANLVTTLDQQGNVSFGPSKQLMFLGLPLDYKDVVQFISPIQALTTVAPRAIDTALKLEQAANRNAVAVQPSGVLKQTGGQPLSSEELAQMAQSFNVARMSNSVAAISEHLTYSETSATPDKMLLSEARNFQALEMSRLANIPGFLCNLSIGGYNYSNNADARQQLWLFACKAYSECISQTLSGDNVLPRGTYVRLNPKQYLAADYLGGYGGEMPDEMPTIEETVRVPLS